MTFRGKRQDRRRRIRFLLGFTALTAGWNAHAQTSALAAQCGAEKARFAVGEPYSEELADRARQAAGARMVRKIEPGGAYTMDLRDNVEIDRRGIVERVRCG